MKAKKILLGLFSIAVMLDIITTLWALKVNGHTHLELNPMFILLGSMVWPIIINIISILVLIWAYRRDNTPIMNFMLCSAFTYGALIRLIAVKGAIGFIKQPVAEATVAATTAAQKVTAYNHFVILNLFIPILVIMAIFWLWSIDYNITPKEAEE